MNTQTLISHVKEHALLNYTTGGWDYIVECWSDAEIGEAILNAGAKSKRAAVRAVAEIAGTFDAVRQDIRGS